MIAALAACHPGGYDGPAPTVLGTPSHADAGPECAEPHALFADDDVSPVRGLSLRVDDTLPADDYAEMLAATHAVARRWQAATCVPITVSDAAPHVVSMRDRDQLYRRLLGRAEGSWDALELKVARGYDTEAILLHELAHGMGRTNDHAEPYMADDGLRAAAFSPGLSRRPLITPLDLELVCARFACECFAPEVR